MENISEKISEKFSRKPQKGIHSGLHAHVDEIRKEYGETHIIKGVGSFGFYLGLLKGVPDSMICQWRSEIRQSNVRTPAKVFVWKVREWKKKPVDNPESDKKI